MGVLTAAEETALQELEAEFEAEATAGGEPQDPDDQGEGAQGQAGDAGAATKDEPQAAGGPEDGAQQPETDAAPAADEPQAPAAGEPANTEPVALAAPDGYLEQVPLQIAPAVEDLDSKLADLRKQLAQANTRFQQGEGDMDADKLGAETARIQDEMAQLRHQQAEHVRSTQHAQAHDRDQWGLAMQAFVRQYKAAGGTVNWMADAPFAMLADQIRRTGVKTTRFDALTAAANTALAALGLPPVGGAALSGSTTAPAQAKAAPVQAKPRPRAVGPTTLANLPSNSRGSAEIAAGQQDPLGGLSAEKAEARLAQMSPAERDRYLYGEG